MLVYQTADDWVIGACQKWPDALGMSEFAR